MDEVYRLVRALRDDALPRNRHFELHATAAARQARRIHRFLRSVERDLRQATELRAITRADGGVRLELGVAAVHFLRSVELDARAHAVLVEDQAFARQLKLALIPHSPA